ncbi:hypothetical protein YC2023_083909 [Brassica napus]
MSLSKIHTFLNNSIIIFDNILRPVMQNANLVRGIRECYVVVRVVTHALQGFASS